MQAFKVFLAILGIATLASSAAARTISGQVLGGDGKPIANAVVFVQEPATLPPAAASSSAIMDQFNKTFVPEMLPIVVGTQVRFPNRDQIRHHVYSFSRPKRFELTL
jgi:plastocyanin